MDAFEYQVYDSEIDKVGQYSLETHLNTNLSGKNTPDYPGKLHENHLTHLTFEFARGMTPNWELGSYLQTVDGEDGITRYAGAKLRSKFVFPDARFQLGVNFELSNVPAEFEQDQWGSEIRPILGYAWGRWNFLFNPIVDIDLTSGASAVPDFSPAFKTVFDAGDGYGIGIEYYADFGDLNQLDSFNHAEQYLFAAYDLLHGPYEINLGLGAGLSDASNPTVAKAIFGFDF